MSTLPNSTTKHDWVKPVLVVKPLSETRAGTGVSPDGVFELQS